MNGTNSGSFERLDSVAPKGRNALARMTKAIPAPANTSQPSNKDDFKHWFNTAYARIKAVCPAWSSNVDEDLEREIRRDWFETFLRSGLVNDASVGRGIAVLKQQRQKFRPTSDEFVEWCKPASELSYPELDDAYQEAANKTYKLRMGDHVEWSHIVVRQAARNCSHSLLNDPKESSFPKFKREYTRAIELHKNGKLESEKIALPRQEIDPSLAYYYELLKNHGKAMADSYLEECEKAGKLINPVVGTVVTIPRKVEKTSISEVVDAAAMVTKAIDTSPIESYVIDESLRKSKADKLTIWMQKAFTEEELQEASQRLRANRMNNIP